MKVNSELIEHQYSNLTGIGLKPLSERQQIYLEATKILHTILESHGKISEAFENPESQAMFY